MFEYAADPVFILDIEGLFIEVNQAACDHLGYSRNELLKMGPKDIDSPVDKDLISERLAQLKTERKAKFEAIHVHRSGKHIPVEMNIRLIEHEGRTYTLNICRDVTEHKELLHELHEYQAELKMQNEKMQQAQIELEEANTHYMNFYSFAPVGFLVLDQSGMIEDINFTGAALIGVIPSKLIHQSFDSLVAKEDIENWHRHYTKALTSDDKLICELAFHHVEPRFIAQLHCQRLKKAGKETVLRIAMIDTTERNRMKAELQKSNKILCIPDKARE